MASIVPLPAPPPFLLEGAALFLDFDGTLVELAEAPDSIAVPSGLPALLGALSERLSGRIAILSGRSITDLDRYIVDARLALSGSHGLELRHADGTLVAPAPPPSLDEARGEIARFAGRVPGLLAEDKPASVALHFRQAPEREAEVERFMTQLATATGLGLQRGKMVVELRPAGADKGDALRTLMAEPDFAGARPVFVGDDLTDEHGFTAAAAMGGAGILVGAPRDTAAHYRLDGVKAVADWLEGALRV
jgi:trehalose 6-phosphate phosphatase